MEKQGEFMVYVGVWKKQGEFVVYVYDAIRNIFLFLLLLINI